jgi:A/G-specific adenine glycosylase
MFRFVKIIPMSDVEKNDPFDGMSVLSFRSQLLQWFDANKRDLPWRKDLDPYRVWVSEIMLQQTRVAVVASYYPRFLERFPDVGTLARSREESVLAAWSGLGYYRRARGLHASAKIVVREYGEKFPESAEQWRKLPGIGRYTAAAIASISFGEKCAVVDGNVERVLGRVLGEGNPHVSPLRCADRGNVGHQGVGCQGVGHQEKWEIAQQLLSPERPGDFNQAMMELGATVCIPARPLCGECPVASMCRTQGAVKNRTTEARKKREVSYALWTHRRQVYLTKRSATVALMAGMWELPKSDEERSSEHLFKLRHSITDTDYTVAVVRQSEPRDGEWVPHARLSRLALTGLTRKILRKAGIIE